MDYLCVPRARKRPGGWHYDEFSVGRKFESQLSIVPAKVVELLIGQMQGMHINRDWE